MGKTSYSIRELEQIRALRSPVRQEIVDTVQARGTCSVADIARELGRHADGLYYHLKVLLKVGLLGEVDPRSSRGRSERLYTTRSPGSTMRLRYDPADPENVDAVLGAVASLLRTTERDFGAAFRPETVTEGPHRELWAGRLKGWLSDEDLIEVNRLIQELRELFDRPKQGGRDRLHAFTFVNVPLCAKSVRRDEE